MIDHTWVEVSNFEVSKAFYEKALSPLGYTKLMELWAETNLGASYAGFGEAKPDFWIASGTPNHPHVHVAFGAKSRKVVDDFYSQAIAAGGYDNGAPGLREHYGPNYYAAFVLDPDGHNIEAVCRSEQ